MKRDVRACQPGTIPQPQQKAEQAQGQLQPQALGASLGTIQAMNLAQHSLGQAGSAGWGLMVPRSEMVSRAVREPREGRSGRERL